MIKKEQGLKTNFEFNITRKYGTYYPGQFLHLYILKPTNYQGESKLGIVISNKFDTKAVVRNKTKRILKHIFRDYLSTIKDKSCWLVIYPKVSIKNKKYEEISADVNKILQKVSLP